MDSPPHVQAIINCTVTPSMTFTKTSQKFGQWADSRANTVYGLGFATEQQLHQVGRPPEMHQWQQQVRLLWGLLVLRSHRSFFLFFLSSSHETVLREV